MCAVIVCVILQPVSMAEGRLVFWFIWRVSSANNYEWSTNQPPYTTTSPVYE